MILFSPKLFSRNSEVRSTRLPHSPDTDSDFIFPQILNPNFSGPDCFIFCEIIFLGIRRSTRLPYRPDSNFIFYEIEIPNFSGPDDFVFPEIIFAEFGGQHDSPTALIAILFFRKF